MSADGFEVGHLVRWTLDDGDVVGVIKELDNQRITVEWDDERTPPIFVRKGAAIERVQLPPQVRRRSDDEPGILIEPALGAPRPSWKVALIGQGGVTKVIPESDLRPDDSVGPVGRLLNGKAPGSSRQTNITTATHYLLDQHFNNDLVSLDATRVDVKPHQVSVVHRVVTNYPHRYLLCDEVGLGKTIEAGLILKELRERGLADRVLIIVPPNLRRQWQFELKTKFNETFSILDSGTVRYVRSQGEKGNPFAKFDSVIVSDAWVVGDDWSKQVSECAWDLVIVDEAHHARSKSGKGGTTRLYRLVQRLLDRSLHPDRAALLLTATPMQLDSHELYSLIEILDPALFPSEEHFDEHRRRLPSLSSAVVGLHELSEGETPTDELCHLVASWLGIEPEQVPEFIRRDGVEALSGALAEKHLLSDILIRNRKAVVGGFMPRRAHRWKVRLSDEEQRALDRVEDFVAQGYAAMAEQKDQSIGFLMVAYQKMMASSIAALRDSLAKRRDRLNSGEVSARASTKELRRIARETDDDAEAVLGAAIDLAALNRDEAEELTQLVELLDAIQVDSKADELRRQLRVLREEATVPKVLIFTQFRATQNHLASVLTADGWNVSQFHGQMSVQAKDDAVERFRDDAEPHILISTEAGGEGRNFQFCHLLVNYDLPWNPMRVEQRIGRVDRLGQENIVEIFNFWVEGTIEERVLNVLESRINIFEETVGGLDPILGEAEKDIRKIMMRNRLDRPEVERKVGARLEANVAAARTAEEQLRDLILDTRSFSREIAEQVAGQTSPITSEDQEHFMTRLLASQRTHIKRQGREYHLHFHDPFLSDHEDLFPDGPKRRAVFRPNERTDSEFVEFLALGHPIIDACVGEVTAPSWPGVSGARRLSADGVVAPGSGWLFVWQVTVPDLRARSELIPVFVNDLGHVEDEVGAHLVERAVRADEEESIDQSDISHDTLEVAHESAEHHLGTRLIALEKAARERTSERVEVERSRLEAYYEYRIAAAHERRAGTMSTVERLRASDDTGDHKILPVWEARLAEDELRISSLDEERHDRIRKLDLSLELPADYQLLQVVRVEVVGAPGLGG